MRDTPCPHYTFTLNPTRKVYCIIKENMHISILTQLSNHTPYTIPKSQKQENALFYPLTHRRDHIHAFLDLQTYVIDLMQFFLETFLLLLLKDRKNRKNVKIMQIINPFTHAAKISPRADDISVKVSVCSILKFLLLLLHVKRVNVSRRNRKIQTF